MSKEIALLIRAFTAIDSRDFPVLYNDIKELLAQPEPEPEHKTCSLKALADSSLVDMLGEE